MEQPTLIERIIQSAFFKNAQRKAGDYARDNQRLASLVEQVKDKSKRVSGEADFLPQVATLVRMVRAHLRGDYQEIPWRSLLLVVATLIYFVSPFDFIPDLLPIVGLTDDITLVFWIVKSLREDIQRFREWELSSASPAVEVE